MDLFRILWCEYPYFVLRIQSQVLQLPVLEVLRDPGV